MKLATLAEPVKAAHREGKIDTATAAALAEYLVQFDDGSNVTVDFSGVTFLDASGMHALHAAHARLGRQGSTLSILARTTKEWY